MTVTCLGEPSKARQGDRVPDFGVGVASSGRVMGGLIEKGTAEQNWKERKE